MRDRIFPVIGAIPYPKQDDNSNEPKLSEWDFEWTYYIDDLVAYNGNIYRSLVNDNLGKQPDLFPVDWIMLDITNPAGRLEVTFTAADLITGGGKVLIGTIPGNRRAFEVTLVIHDVFQDRSITIGDAAIPDRVMLDTENKATHAASYEAWSEAYYTVATNLFVYITGVSATGRGTAIIYYA